MLKQRLFKELQATELPRREYEVPEAAIFPMSTHLSDGNSIFT